jgi:hypothetical protein
MFLCWLTLALSPASHAQVQPALGQKSPDAAAIVALVERNGHVPIIVEFASPIPREQIKPDPSVLAPLKAQIAAIQDSIIRDHFGSASNPRQGQGFARSIIRFDITPAFAVVVNRAELEALAVDPRVVRIHLNKSSRAE